MSVGAPRPESPKPKPPPKPRSLSAGRDLSDTCLDPSDTSNTSNSEHIANISRPSSSEGKPSKLKSILKQNSVMDKVNVFNNYIAKEVENYRKPRVPQKSLPQSSELTFPSLRNSIISSTSTRSSWESRSRTSSESGVFFPSTLDELVEEPPTQLVEEPPTDMAKPSSEEPPSGVRLAQPEETQMAKVEKVANEMLTTEIEYVHVLGLIEMVT